MFLLRGSYGTGHEQLVLSADLPIMFITNHNGRTRPSASFVLQPRRVWSVGFGFPGCLSVCTRGFQEMYTLVCRCLHFPELSLNSLFAWGSLSRILGSGFIIFIRVGNIFFDHYFFKHFLLCSPLSCFRGPEYTCISPPRAQGVLFTSLFRYIVSISVVATAVSSPHSPSLL